MVSGWRCSHWRGQRSSGWNTLPAWQWKQKLLGRWKFQRQNQLSDQCRTGYRICINRKHQSKRKRMLLGRCESSRKRNLLCSSNRQQLYRYYRYWQKTGSSSKTGSNGVDTFWDPLYHTIWCNDTGCIYLGRQRYPGLSGQPGTDTGIFRSGLDGIWQSSRRCRKPAGSWLQRSILGRIPGCCRRSKSIQEKCNRSNKTERDPSDDQETGRSKRSSDSGKWSGWKYYLLCRCRKR